MKTANEKIVDEMVKENQQMYDFWFPHKPVKLYTGEETIVEQHHEETTNINKIIGRYRRSGVLPAYREGSYADVSEVRELMDVKLTMAAAMEAYESLPRSITDQFADVGEFMRYVENLETINAKPVEEPEVEAVQVEVTTENPPPEGE